MYSAVLMFGMLQVRMPWLTERRMLAGFVLLNELRGVFIAPSCGRGDLLQLTRHRAINCTSDPHTNQGG